MTAPLSRVPAGDPLHGLLQHCLALMAGSDCPISVTPSYQPYPSSCLAGINVGTSHALQILPGA